MNSKREQRSLEKENLRWQRELVKMYIYHIV